MFQEADESILKALGNIGQEEQPDDEIKEEIETLVCKMYLPKTDMYIATVIELRWFLFRKKQAQSDRSPPTQAALHQLAILCTHFQLMVWNKDIVPNPELPSSGDYG